jgi:hypothetical protein
LIEKVADYVHMLDGFMIVVLIYVRESWILARLHVLLDDELFPNLNDLGEEAPRLLVRFFLLEELAHIIVATTEVNTLRAVLLTLEEDALGELLQRFFVSLGS